jgi:SynChlorMet cassette protein ScmD
MLNKDKPIPNPLIVLREEFDDWAILFNPDTAEALGINPIGVVIWKLIDGRHCIEDIISHIEDHFTDVPDGAADHVAKFIENLAEQGFVGYEFCQCGQ